MQLVVVTGPMFAGKTQYLIDRLCGTDPPAIVFKAACDSRSTGLLSHNGSLYGMVENIRNFREMVRKYKGARKAYGDEEMLICVDEAQFIDDPQYVREIATEESLTVIIAGLDLDYAGYPFETMAELMCWADEVIKLRARCSVCGAPATRTQRLIGNKPAPLGRRIIIGGQEMYQARCIQHWVAPQTVSQREILPDYGEKEVMTDSGQFRQ